MKLPAMFRPLTLADKFKRMAQALHAQARQIAAEESFRRFGDGPVPSGEQPIIVIVLTIAHLDHQPENCDPANLRALCQRHHLAHDLVHHQHSALATRRARSQTADLFDWLSGMMCGKEQP